MMTSSYRDQAVAALASIEAMPPEARPAVIDLVYYNARAWQALRPDEPGRLAEHAKALDWLARRLAKIGMAVRAVLLDLDDYTSWLNSHATPRPDTPDNRAAFAASSAPRYRLGLRVEPNAIGWAAVQIDDAQLPPASVSGSTILDRLRRPDESQRDLADRLGMNVRTLQRIHSGAELPPVSLILRALGPDA